MGLFAEIKRRSHQLAGPALGLLVLGYLGYHLAGGDRGLLAYWRLEARLSEAEARHAGLRAEHEVWERRVSLLRADNLDLDLLEERARAVLSLGRPGEYYLITPPESSSQ